ncbi:hypothetical protein BD779DRAFT_1477700 [Infundibulicybe gibba]|nr:hypothetical protein BD779DRAFT_1477700 [Infundibulicybe gibba]
MLGDTSRVDPGYRGPKTTLVTIPSEWLIGSDLVKTRWLQHSGGGRLEDSARRNFGPNPIVGSAVGFLCKFRQIGISLTVDEQRRTGEGADGTRYGDEGNLRELFPRLRKNRHDERKDVTRWLASDASSVGVKWGAEQDIVRRDWIVIAPVMFVDISCTHLGAPSTVPGVRKPKFDRPRSHPRIHTLLPFNPNTGRGQVRWWVVRAIEGRQFSVRRPPATSVNWIAIVRCRVQRQSKNPIGVKVTPQTACSCVLFPTLDRGMMWQPS